MEKEIVEEKCPNCGYEKANLLDWYGEDMPVGLSKELYFQLQCRKCRKKFTHTASVCNG